MARTPFRRPAGDGGLTRRWSFAPFLMAASLLGTGPLGAVPPPVLETPLYDCSTGVWVLGFDTGAELRAQVNGSITDGGTLASAWGYRVWVPVTKRLEGGDRVRLSQVVNGVESALSQQGIVAAPFVAPPAHFALPLEACAEGAYVHNKLAGDIWIDTDQGDPPLAQEADNEGSFPTLLSRPLIPGETLQAGVDHCRLGVFGSPETPVSSIYIKRVSIPPTPIIDPATAVECHSFLRVHDVIPGARVQVFNGSSLIGDDIAAGAQVWVHLQSPMQPSWPLTATQSICTEESLPSPMVVPISLDSLPPPSVDPIWEGQTHLFVDSPVLAFVTVFVDGGPPIRDNVFVFGKTQLNVDEPFQAGQEVGVHYTVCGHASPDATVIVQGPPPFLPPPLIVPPLEPCTDLVTVSGLVAQAEVTIKIDNQEWYYGFASGSTTTFAIGPMLQTGEEVAARQSIGSVNSPLSPAVSVFAETELEKPIVKTPVVECQREVVVKGVRLGAFVTVYLDGLPFASAYASSTTVHVPTFPLPLDFDVTADQRLACLDPSEVSDPVEVTPHDAQALKAQPVIVEPLIACQTSFGVKDLVPGTELDVYINNAFKKRVYVSSTSMHVSIQPPLAEGQRVRVFVVVCGVRGVASKEVEVVVEVPEAPRLLGPIFHGDVRVTVSDAMPSSLVRVYADGDLVGVGSGSLQPVTIFLWQPAAEGKEMTATAAFCGPESLPSEPVEVQPNLECRPHDVLVTNYSVDGSGAQCILIVTGRNIYQGSQIVIDGTEFMSFPWTQLTPKLGPDRDTQGNPIDTIGAVAMSLFSNGNGGRFQGGDVLEISVKNPDGFEGELIRFRQAGSNIFRSPHYVLAASMDELDSDGDGLTDTEEGQQGLATLGAHPLRKDIFVEVDWMADDDHTHQPHPAIFQPVKNAFAKAWVLNADGSRGIHLNVQLGDALDHWETIAFDAAEEPDITFGELYDNFFTDARKGLFRYCVFGHSQPGTEYTGRAYTNSDRLMVTDNECIEGIYPTWYVERTKAIFMHELGHSLGLEHGGDTVTNRKPNYPSVMRYGYSLDGGISVDCNSTQDGVYDYSYGLLRNLNEDSLLEAEGICNHEPMDWNGDGPITPSEISWNINDDKVSDYDGTDEPLFNEFVDAGTTHSTDPLRDHCDWCFLTGIGVKRPQ